MLFITFSRNLLFASLLAIAPACSEKQKEPQKTDSLSNAQSDLLEIQRIIFGGGEEADAASAKVQLPKISARLITADGKPAAGIPYQMKKTFLLGEFSPGASSVIESGVSDADGRIFASVHPQYLLLKLSYQMEGESWRALEDNYYSADRADWGDVKIPARTTFSGVVDSSLQGNVKPVKAWIWETPNLENFHLLPILHEDLLLHGDDCDLLYPAVSVEHSRNYSDLQNSPFAGVELDLHSDGRFSYTGRMEKPAICVLDNQGRYHWRKWPIGLERKSEKERVWKISLSQISKRIIEVRDDQGEIAVGAEIASATHGSFPDHQILSVVGKYPDSQSMEIPAMEHWFHTVAGRWSDSDPWYTWDWMMMEEIEDEPYILPRPRSVSVRTSFSNGSPLTHGSLISDSSGLWYDPPKLGSQSATAIGADGTAFIQRLPPMNEFFPIVHANGIYPMPIELNWNSDLSELEIVVVPLGEVKISLSGPAFPAEFFPAQISLALEPGGIPIHRWIEKGQVAVFREVGGTTSRISAYGANGVSAHGEWDGKASDVVLSEIWP